MSDRKKIYCCGCECDIDARLTDGSEIYPHRMDLSSLPFWKCDGCSNFVGCHHKTKNRTAPLGVIPTPEIKNFRMKIHNFIDPLWRSGEMPRSKIYADLSLVLGWKYHTAKIRTAEDAEKVLFYAYELYGSGARHPTGLFKGMTDNKQQTTN